MRLAKAASIFPALPVASTRFDLDGYFVADNFMSAAWCARLLDAIEAYRRDHALPEIYRAASDRPLRYSVIDGHRIRDRFSDVDSLYRTVNAFVNKLSQLDLVPLDDARAACNINLTDKGGTYRWHYDRNAVTAILYLNETTGGETECYPNYRLALGGRWRYSGLQRVLDAALKTTFARTLFGKRLLFKPVAGKLLVMKGNRCLHAVRPVLADRSRVNIVMAYDVLGARYAVEDSLNEYLYESRTALAFDPNYQRRT